MAGLMEAAPGLALRRLAADDCFIPLGRAATVTLPSRETIIAAALSAIGATPPPQTPPPAFGRTLPDMGREGILLPPRGGGGERSEPEGAATPGFAGPSPKWGGRP
jgi:hypothetical protein